jgi:hypothetical protein
MLKSMIVAVALTLLLATEALAQGAPCTPQTSPAAVAFGRSQVSFTSPGHTATRPDGQPEVVDYFGEVRVKGSPALVTNFTIPKASMVPVAGATVPPGCMQTQLPGMTGLLASNTYTLSLYSRGPGGQAVAASTADFFLDGAPRGTGLMSFVTP